MSTSNSSAKNAKGSVSIEAFQGRLRLRLPRQLFDGKQKYLTLGLPDTVVNRRLAEAKAMLLESDIKLERFDLTLAKYGGKQAPIELVAVVHASESGSLVSSLSLLALWAQYFADKRSGLKPKTIEKYGHFTRLFEKVGDLPLWEALAIKKQLELITTKSRTKDALMYLSAACKWGIQHGLVASDSFVGMSSAMPKHRYMVDPQPNAFTEEERDRIIQNFQTDQRKGISYRSYAGFVEFLFLSGCRPSEAVGLCWKHIDPDFKRVSFEGSLVQIGNQRVRSEGSKNNRTRKLTVSKRLQAMLVQIKPKEVTPDSLVFLSADGDSINYRNFARRAWKTIVDPIKPNTTPYCCRDTFITIQLLKGVSSAVISQWCDTSTHMIDRNYADKLKLTQLQPED
jgi:integrase